MQLLLLLFAPLYISLQFVDAVKIGVSKTTTPTPTTATAPTTIVMESSTGTTRNDDITSPVAMTTTGEAITSNISTTSPVPHETTTTVKPTATTTPAVTTITTTTIASATTTASSNSTDIITPPTISESLSYYCYCNLMLEVCDINCCCDQECTQEALQAFNCFAPSKQPQLHSSYNDFQYEHGLPSCKVNDGWLCVFRTNKKSQKKQEPKLVLDTANYYKWPNLLIADITEEEEELSHSNEFYKYGDPLRIFNTQTKEIQNFDLPYDFKPPYCQLKEPIRFLKPFTRLCLVPTIEKLQEDTEKLLKFVEKTKLLTKPQNGHDKNIERLKAMSVKRCHKEKCIDLTQILDDYNITEIVIKIMHNYTEITEAIIELRDRDVNNDQANNEQLWQRYELQFIDQRQANVSNSTEMGGKVISGPLGYVQGEPIIVAHYITNHPNEHRTLENQIIDYFHENASQNRHLSNRTLMLFTKRQELCNQSHEKEDLISFGINTLKQCTARLDNINLQERNLRDENFTAICIRLHKLTWSHLFGNEHLTLENMPALLISQLGKPQNISDRWLRLEMRNYEFAPIIGHYNEQAKTFTCRNILLSIAYDFHIGTFTVHDVSNQALLQHAILTLGQRNDLEFSLNETVQVPISVSVMFYDYTSISNESASNRIVTLFHTNIALLLILFLFDCKRN